MRKLLFSIAVLLLLASPAYPWGGSVMVVGGGTPAGGTPIAFSASDDRTLYNATTSIANDVGIDVAVGDLIVVTLAYPASSTVTMSDSADTPNTYTVTTESGATNSKYARIAYSIIENAKVGNIVTATFGTTQEIAARTEITVLKFTKDPAKTWYADGGNVATSAYGTSLATGNYTTTYADGVSVGIGSSGGASTYTTTNINNTGATITPASPAALNSRAFYLLHQSTITDNHADFAVSASAWIGTRFFSFGAN